MPASSEFIALCRSQIVLLTQSLGAALSIVYLTEELTEISDTKLVPIAAHPEAVASWDDDRIFTLLSRSEESRSNHPLLIPESLHSRLDTSVALPVYPEEAETEMHPLQAAEKALLRQQQIVLPLMHQDVVMGLLVTARADRAWNEAEQSQIEKIAETLAIGCLLDQRAQWLAQDLRQQRQLRQQRHDLFDDLLHQFRNPLTALRTFGKLLMKRLKPGDANRSVAEGIVRESDRLQELLQQFDAAIDIDETELHRLLEAASPDEETAEDDVLEEPSVLASRPSLPPPSPLLLPGSLLNGAFIQVEAHAITEVLEPLLSSAEAIAQDRQLTLQSHIPPGLPPVYVDIRALREVLNNLIDNALKYTPAGGQVYIAAQSQPLSDRPYQQAIVIADTGPGIPPQDLEHLFERHYRGVQADTDIPGTGLGLAIARDLVQRMQGEIRVFSPAHTCPLVPQPSPLSAQAHGTAVVVWLPEHPPR